MKFVRNLILALALFLPGYSLAEEDSVYTPEEKASDYIPLPLGLELGGGSMFVAGVEWGSLLSLIYAQERPKDVEDLWVPKYALIWSIRTRYVYDYIDYEHGILLNPNIQGLFAIFTGVAVGPQVGWFSSTGFDYGVSARLDLICLLNIEAGYFFEKKNLYVNFLFSFSILRMGPFDP
jgi:hypothetical protein